MYGKKSKLFCARNIIFLLITLFMSRSLDASEKALSVREQMVENLMQYTPLPNELMTIVTEYALIDEARKNEIYSLFHGFNDCHLRINDKQLDDLKAYELVEMVHEKYGITGINLLTQRYLINLDYDKSIREKMLQKIAEAIKQYPQSINIVRMDGLNLCHNIARASGSARDRSRGFNDTFTIDHTLWDILIGCNVDWGLSDDLGKTCLMHLLSRPGVLRFNPDPTLAAKDKILLKLLCSASINAQNKETKKTALHLAFKSFLLKRMHESDSSERNEIIDFLVEHKADPFIRDEEQKSVFELAQEANLFTLTAFLQRASKS